MDFRKREEKQARPVVLANFLPVDAPTKVAAELDIGAELRRLLRDGKEDDAKELIDAVTSARRMVLWALDRDRTTVTTDDLLSRVAEYARLLRGFLEPPEKPTSAKDPLETTPPKSAKTLRHAVSFVWRDLLDVKGRDWEMTDVALEEASVLMAAAQNLISRVARESLNAANAVEIHATLRRAAGVLAEVRRLTTQAEVVAEDDDDDQDDDDDETVASLADDETAAAAADGTAAEEKKDPLVLDKKDDKTQDDKTAKKKIDPSISPSKMSSSPRSSLDLRLALPEAWAALALGEAQTATLSKAFHHNEWSLIASLCADQVDRYGRGVRGHVDALVEAAPDAANFREWAGKRVSHAFLTSHVETKTLYFSALARYAQGAPLLETAVSDVDDEACAAALAELGNAVELMRDAQAAAGRFVATSKPITYVQDPTIPLQDTFDLLKRAYDRAHQLDTSIFHRGPSSLRPFPDRKSLITAIPLPDPGRSPLWTRAAWDAFDPDKLPKYPSFRVASDSRDCCAIS